MRFNLLIYMVVISFVISSCAYNSQKLSEAKPSMRAPSSSESEENLNASFEQMINSQNPEKEFTGYLNRLSSIFVRAEYSLSEFDKELDDSVSSGSNISFENSKSYKKLIVMRSLGNRLKDKIIFYYLKLTDLKNDKTQLDSKRKMAKDILFAFKSSLDSTDPLKKLSLDELKIEMAMAIKERRGITSKSISPSELPANVFKDQQEKIDTIRKYREKFRSIGKSEQDSNNELTQKIEDLSDNLILVDQKGREPQSDLKYYPSTGPNGNIMGLIFPKNVWALTYDDGPNPVHTPAILKNLEDLGIKATFFWLAQNVIRYQSIIDLAKEKRMVLANHSWSHPQLPKLSEEGLKKEIVQSTQVEARSYGEKIEYFRCPYGAGNSVPRIRQMIADLGMIHVFWNVDTLDWQDKDPNSIVARAQKQMLAAGHGVVLFHDIHPQSVVASKKLIEWTKTFKGTPNEVRWVTLPEIVNEMNGAK